MRFLHFTLAIILAFGLLVGLSVLITLRPVQAASAVPTATIQSLIDAAPNGGTINIAAGTYTESLTVNKTLTLTGVSSDTTVIQAVTGQRVITVTDGNSLRLENLTVTGGHVSVSSGEPGGGVWVISGSLALVNCRIANNSGGGVYQYSEGGRVDVSDSQIEFNITEGSGGGLSASHSIVLLTNTQVLSNAASWAGGGLLLIGGDVALINTQVLSNTAGVNGGGLFVLGSATVTNTLVLSNTAGWDGGGLYIGGRTDLSGGLLGNNRALKGSGGAVNVVGDIEISGTQFISNTAINGGGLQQWAPGYTALITNTNFERNAACGLGGGASVSGTLIISHSTFATNTVDAGPITTTIAGGGGVYAAGPAQIAASTFVSNLADCTDCGSSSGGGGAFWGPTTIENSTFDRNMAGDGGAVYSPIVTITRSIFTRNQAGNGGAVYGSVVSITRSVFTRNLAWIGGALMAQFGQITDSSFVANQAFDVGGAAASQGRLTLSNTSVISNTASHWGGGLLAIDLDAENVLLADNQADRGAALYVYQAALRHVTIAGTMLRAVTAMEIMGGAVLITDSIVSNYTVGISQTSGTLSADYSLFFTPTPTQTSGGIVMWGAHNLTADPRFVDPATGNYHLALGSPAIDSGTDVGVTTDLAGLARPNGKGFDMGAYEFQPPLYLPVVLRQ